ncbi:MAG: transglutaminase family protein [Thermoplasmatota archaeon]
MRLAWLLVALTASPCLAGCLEPFGLGGPAYRVERTQLVTGDAWNREAHFSVRVREQAVLPVRIEASADDGRSLQAQGLSNATLPPVALDLPDGTWTVTYFVDGRKWERIGPARIDATPPAIHGLETLGTAQGGSYLLGAGATVDADATVRVVRQGDGAQVASALPIRLTGLGDGVHGYDVVASDAAGNQAVATVQVRAGSATQMPPGRFSLGVTSRYTSSARLWDLTDLDAYLSPAAARMAAQGEWLGEGTALTPQDPAVQAVVQQVTNAKMSTGRAALELFRWLVDHADYDSSRLTAQDLLTPAQTMKAGGGVCRDLAAIYASLLRVAGIPARLVTGYLGGRVGGFHAWVEFYGGDGHGPGAWVPVDVSPVDGPYAPTIALQAFGARLPNMLGLHAVTPGQERGDWSHAAALDVRYPPDAPAPDVELADNLTAEFREEAVLCIDPDRLARTIAPDDQACGPSFPRYAPHYLARAAFVLDYGAQVTSAKPGTTVTATLSSADPATIAPDTVETLTYGALFSSDPAAGTQTGTLRR